MRRPVRPSIERPPKAGVVCDRSRPSYRAMRLARASAIQGRGGSVEKPAMPACLQCGALMPPRTGTGRPRRYCGPRCRRRREYARRIWSRAQRWIRAAEMNARWEGLTPRQREAHRQLAGELRRRAGVRP